MIRLLSLLAVLLVSPVWAQYVCPSCGKVHSTAPSSVSTGNSRAWSLMNAKRARAGRGPLTMNAQMQAGAQSKVNRAASLGITGHQGGSMYGGNKEGVGYASSETPMACYLMSAPAGTQAGFAMAHGRRGWHSVLLLSHGGHLPSGATGGPGRNIRRFSPFRRR